jgi:hypothetical protein
MHIDLDDGGSRTASITGFDPGSAASNVLFVGYVCGELRREVSFDCSGDVWLVADGTDAVNAILYPRGTRAEDLRPALSPTAEDEAVVRSLQSRFREERSDAPSTVEEIASWLRSNGVPANL